MCMNILLAAVAFVLRPVMDLLDQGCPCAMTADEATHEGH